MKSGSLLRYTPSLPIERMRYMPMRSRRAQKHTVPQAQDAGEAPDRSSASAAMA